MTYTPTERDGQIRAAILKQGTDNGVSIYAKWLGIQNGDFYDLTPESRAVLKKALDIVNTPAITCTGLTIHWFEGRTDMGASTERRFDTIREANAFLVMLASVKSPDSGYDKVKFTAHFSDNNDYTGRFDLHHIDSKQETSTGAICFLQHMRDYMAYLASVKCALAVNENEARAWLRKLESVEL